MWGWIFVYGKCTYASRLTFISTSSLIKEFNGLVIQEFKYTYYQIHDHTAEDINDQQIYHVMYVDQLLQDL